MNENLEILFRKSLENPYFSVINLLLLSEDHIKNGQ